MNRRTLKTIQFAIALVIVIASIIVSQWRQTERGVPPRTGDAGQPEQRQPAEFPAGSDVAKTLDRIDSGRRLKYHNDGEVFENRERRLPRQPRGYYREWVHPTPGVEGPGPRRVVTGSEGEAWFTRDHYRTFERVR